MIEFDLLHSEKQTTEIASAWDAIVAERGSEMPYGLGPTSSYRLVHLLWQIHAPRSDLWIAVATVDGAVAAIMPCYSVRRRAGFLGYTAVSHIPALYPGRTGVIFGASQDMELDRCLLRYVLGLNWDLFEVTFVANSSDERHFLSLVTQSGMSVSVQDSTACPYIEFPESWEQLLGTFSKNFRHNLRSRERKLHKEGRIRIARFERQEQVTEFLAAVGTIERGSWKEAAGTSLTQNPAQQRFHEKMAPVSAADGNLRGYVMFLDELPIAHIIGLYAQGVFYSLKTSFVDEHRTFSPGVVLKAAVMKELIAEGARYWDFVGPAEDHKMQWTSEVYTLNRYAVYSRTFTGRSLLLRNAVGRRLRRAMARREIRASLSSSDQAGQ